MPLHKQATNISSAHPVQSKYGISIVKFITIDSDAGVMVGARNSGCGRGNAILLIILFVLVFASIPFGCTASTGQPEAVTSWSTSANSYFVTMESAKLLSYNGYIINVGGYNPAGVGTPYADVRKAQVQSNGDIGT